MKKIAVITAFKPNKINQGNPTGLIDFLIRELECNYVVSVFHLECGSLLNKLGFLIQRIKINFDSFDFIFVYPFYSIFSLPEKYYFKAFVLGPDASSLVWYRRSNLYSIFLPKFWLFRFVSAIFLHKEFIVFRKGATLLVVGENDKKFLLDKKNINSFYLPHPIVEDSIPPFFSDCEDKIFVISGHFSKDMVCLSSIELIRKKIPNSNLLILGKKNFFLLEYFIDFKVTLIDFVIDYSEVCVPNLHIHLCPLAFGGGTKNRVLSALHYGCLVFGTEISNENICHPNLYEIKDLNQISSLKPVRFSGFKNSVNKKFSNSIDFLLG